MIISLEESARQLTSCEVVAIPTETVYGLAASIYSEKAIKQIFILKNRPLTNPLIVHISHLSQLNEFVQMPEGDCLKLAQAFWPGPLTMILPLLRPQALSPWITAGLPTVAVRMPSQPETLELIRRIGPLVAPSANLSGLPSATRPAHIAHDFGDAFPILEGVCGSLGIESTIIASVDGKIFIGREGALLSADMEPILGYKPTLLPEQERPICPGQHFRHYAPHARIHLIPYKAMTADHCVVIGFNDRNYPFATRFFPLGSTQDPQMHQAKLYAILRELDDEKIKEAYVDSDFLPDERSQLIKNRLIKASSCQ